LKLKVELNSNRGLLVNLVILLKYNSHPIRKIVKVILQSKSTV